MPPRAESGASPRSSRNPYPIVLRAIPIASDTASALRRLTDDRHRLRLERLGAKPG